MNIKEMTSEASEGLDRAQERVQDLGHTAGGVLEGARQETAAALEDAASSVRSTGRSAAETTETLSGKAADQLDSAAAYVRSHDVLGMLRSVRQVIGRHPTAFVVLAAGLGFLVGSSVRRNK